jgi:hypothetical protein
VVYKSILNLRDYFSLEYSINYFLVLLTLLMFSCRSMQKHPVVIEGSLAGKSFQNLGNVSYHYNVASSNKSIINLNDRDIRNENNSDIGVRQTQCLY